MGNALIKNILDSLVNSYNSGACDDITGEEQEELIEALTGFKDRMDYKQDTVYTVEEASQYLNVTRQTLNNYVKEGKLHPKKHKGGVLEFKLRELKLFVKHSKKDNYGLQERQRRR